ncbi:trypsin-like peptidase domain-containing protein [Cytophagaceae bacterium BD1B2-1]|uniref:Trypsin-like peptidase domain-containing protein n=2 Tax=Xanthocytophaga agilis TaxID=3048010 RepID=A0AAE3UFN6_9BACT|nr:trypsin-like peptidase domain-containing protein [Xanthocytophaga agilis]
MNLRLYIISLFLSSLLGGVVALTGYKMLFPEIENETIEQKQNRFFASPVSNHKTDTSFSVKVPDGLNFVYAAEKVKPAVVHIKTRYEQLSISSPETGDENEEGSDDWFHDFHGFDGPFKGSIPRESAGSGVIISPDGYIATNNHVIEKASEIEVILEDKRSYSGTVIGTDPTTDLALIKIEEENLPFVRYGNTDQLHVGEWVLAIGNPFDLTSTVTAGIISGKGRNINILKDKDNLQIESFIQTDAAVNPGNSGGALVNLRGELMGINTAIASNTGISQGYSFAVPVSLTKKVMDDLLHYGSVQRALLGVHIRDVDAKEAKENGLKQVRGVLVEDINEQSAAQAAGIRSGDVIFKIDNYAINSMTELQSIVGTYHPGDKIAVWVEREGQEQKTWVTLRNSNGNTLLPKPKFAKTINIFGADMAPASSQEKKSLGIGNGVKIVRIADGRIKDAGIRVGFIITEMDSQPVNSAEEVFKIINNSQRAIVVEGVFPNGTKGYHAIAP